MILGEWSLKNPVMIREIRTRMRGNRAFILLTAHLIILGLFITMSYLILRSTFSSSWSLENRRTFGKAVFGLIVWLELIMVSFIAPALTAGSISTEREHQTLDLLRVTLLTARNLVFGKYLSGLIFIFLLLFTSVPLQSLTFLSGGVLPEEIFLGVLILTVSAITFCAVGIFFSALIPRTLVSTVLAYAIAIFLVFGIPMILLIILILLTNSSGSTFDQLTPLSQTLLIFSGWILISSTPLATMIGTEAVILDQQSVLLANIEISNQLTVTLLSPWIPFATIYLGFSILLLLISVRLVKKFDY
jgi:ABC-type transport system involved in multi-copper enzyme maturation permease subunit